ncbi:SRPBCC family protein [Amycolatopsis taiwanensis]|uniref:Activator of HSP90 ATPase n=1 Tax=Amycolatopsis taiwanensis TaxID=342230 RepID=A0A9W6QYP3_9PSEU|nr:SRPBCC family protein [Amycolatopsis taiwanensis]GLY64993.1 activator of HSP90 ATPase [Amycolatopsis taiwanensis]
MEYGTIAREIHIDATPDVVFEVITKPEHIAQWWGFDASFPAVPGGDGRMTKRRRDGFGTLVVPIHVVETDAPRRFVFRWVHPEDEPATPQNSLLVTFELAPVNGGTLLRLTEAGFREIGWEAAQLEEYYHRHCVGWDQHLPNLAAYAAGLVRS